MMVRMETCLLMVLMVVATITAEMAASTHEAGLLARTSHSLKRVETRSTAVQEQEATPLLDFFLSEDGIKSLLSVMSWYVSGILIEWAFQFV